MRGWSTICLVAAIAVFAIYFFNFDVDRPGALPEVKVEGGALPKGDVEAGDIDIGSKTITVPTIDFDTPEEQAKEKAAGFDDPNH